jgi:N-acetylmuramoyl-L-alanine amidase
MQPSSSQRRRRLALIAVLGVVVAAWWLASGSGPGTSATKFAGTPVNAGAFARGACMSYPPTDGDRHLTVFLDAGHGGIDPGSIGRTQSGETIYEAAITLRVELNAMALLRRTGFRVVVSRTANTSVAKLAPDDVDGRLLTALGVHADVAARDVCANDAHANVLVGIYFDAGAASNAGSVTGYDAARPFASQNRRLAILVQRDVLGAMNRQGWSIPSEGVQTDDRLGSSLNSTAVTYGHLLLLGPASPGFFASPSLMPGALIEPLFITDPFEGSIADSAHGQQVIADGLARAVEQYFPSRRRR